MKRWHLLWEYRKDGEEPSLHHAVYGDEAEARRHETFLLTPRPGPVRAVNVRVEEREFTPPAHPLGLF